MALALAVLAVAVMMPAVGGAEASSGDGTPRCANVSCLVASTQSSPEQQLSDRFAPIVVLRDQSADCDKSGEAYFPAPVEVTLGNPEVSLRQDVAGKPIVVTPVMAGDLIGKDDSYYIDLPGQPTNADCNYEQAFKEVSGGQPAVAYAHIAGEQGQQGIVLQYWFYYYFNDWNNKHESDWEFIQLTFDAESASEALALEPSLVVYAQHGTGERADWDDEKLHRDGDHPIVYVAAGSHASYFEDAMYVGKGEQGSGFGCDNATGPGHSVTVEARLIPEQRDAQSPFAWVDFPGRWGELESGEFDGPTGPITKSQWEHPITWQQTVRDSNVKMPSKDTVGPNTVKTFCRVVAWGSDRLLSILHTAPYLLLAVLVAIVASGGVTLRRTAFRPADTIPVRERRRFGQILSAAFRLYTAHPLPFLACGAIFIPAGILAAGVQAAFFAIPLVDAFLEVAENSTLIEAALALLVGSLTAGVTYIFVVATTVAAVRLVEQGEAPSPVGAFRMVLDHLGALVRGRALSIAIVTLLTIVVVGIPWAIYRGIRWVFVEQEVIFEDLNGRGALAGSARAVDAGSWWRTAGIVGVLGVIGLLTGPLVGTGVLLFSSAPLAFVNIIGSAVYVVVVPYVAIALTLLYFDLKETERTTGVSRRG